MALPMDRRIPEVPPVIRDRRKVRVTRELRPAAAAVEVLRRPEIGTTHREQREAKRPVEVVRTLETSVT